MNEKQYSNKDLQVTRKRAASHVKVETVEILPNTVDENCRKIKNLMLAFKRSYSGI